MSISLLLRPPSAAAQTLVQKAANPGSTSVVLPSAQTAGNLNVVVIGWSNVTSSVSTVTDSAGNSYLPAIGVGNRIGISQTIFYAKNINAFACSPTCNTVTVAFNQTPATPDVRVYEFSGLDTTSPLDTSATGSGNGTTANSGSVTTNSATDLLIGGGTTNYAFSAVGSGYTLLQKTTFGDQDEFQTVSAAGSYSASATLTNSEWVMQMVAFRAAGQTPPVFAAPTLASISPTSGPDTGGTGVTLTGTGFQPGAMVFVGTAPGGVLAANCVVSSSTTLACNMPADNSGPKDITVENVDGQNASLVAGFDYTLVSPSVTSVTPSSGATNGNTSITISGKNFQTGVKVEIGGEPVSNLNLVNSTTINATTPAGSVGAADVVVTNADGGSITDTGGYTYAVSSGPVNFIQRGGKSESVNSLTSIDVLMPQAQKKGDLNVVIIGWGDNTAHTVGITDGAGNTYTEAIQPLATPTTSLNQTIWYAKNINASASNTLHVTFSPGAVAPDVRVLEYSGLDPSTPLDTNPASASVKTGTSAVADSGAVSTTFTNNLIIGAAMVSQSVTGAGNGFTTVMISANDNNAEHQINGNAVSGADPSATLTGSSTKWLMQALTFHANPNVAPPAFTMSVSAPPAVNPGSSASATITINSQNGFSGTVALACTVPGNAGLGCSISPKSVKASNNPG